MRRLARHLVVVIVAASAFVGVAVGPAAAENSATSLAGPNAWLITDLQAAGYGTATAADAGAMAAGITSAPAASTGFSVSSLASSGLGQMVATTVGLGGGIFAWQALTGGPSLPEGAPTVVYGGSPTTGWCNGSGCSSFGTTTSSTQIVVQKHQSPLVITGGRWQFCFRTYVQGTTPPAWSTSSSASTNTTSNFSVPKSLSGPTVLDVVPNTAATASGTTAPASGCGSGLHLTALVPKSGAGQTVADPSTAGDPSTVPRTIKTTITCKDSSGASHTYTDISPSFTFDPASPSSLPQVPALDCPAGMWLDSGGRELQTSGTSQTVPMQTYDAPPWVETQIARFPECLPVGTQACALHVKVIVGELEKECSSYVLGAENPCYKWLRASDRAERFRCYFGGYLIGLRACRGLKEAYSPSPTITPSEPINPDNPDPDDPDVGDPEAPVDPTPESTPGLDDSGCVPHSITEILNPWWVFKATGCALVWAFVPKTSLSARIATIRGTLTTRVPFSYLAPLGTLITPAIGQSCPDWTITVGDWSDNWICGQQFTTLVRGARPVFLGFMGLLALWPLIRSTAYAAFPIIKPQPGVLR